MSKGLEVLHAVCRDHSRTAFRRLRPELFNQTERPAYDAIRNYTLTYGQIPSLEVVRELGIRLFPTTGHIDFLHNQLLERTSHRIIQERMEEFAGAMNNRNSAAIAGIVGDWHSALNLTAALDSVEDLSDAFERVLEEAVATRANQGLQGVTLGWDVLNSITHGAAAGDVITIVARPQIGKSWTMLKMALSAWEAGSNVLFVTMEMTNTQTALRAMAMLGNLCPNALATGRYDNFVEDQARTIIARSRTGAPFRLLSGDIKKSVSDIDALVAEHHPDIVFIDASYLLKPDKSAKSSKWETASEVAEQIKSMALNRGVPVVQSVQFNRGANKDERGGGLEYIGLTDAIGQLSSLVIGINEGRSPNENFERVYSIFKNRNGPKGKFAVSFEFNPAPSMSYIAPGAGGISVDDGGIELPQAQW